MTLQVDRARRGAARGRSLSIEGVRDGGHARRRPATTACSTVDCHVDARDGVEAAIARAVAGRWDLHRLERQQPTLENVFLHYVSDGPRGAPA